MKHKIWINLIVVLALALGSGGIIPGRQPAAQASPMQVRPQSPSGEHLASGEASRAYAADAVSVDDIGHLGGQVNAVAIVGDHAYVGEGPSLTILDVSAPDAPVVLGRSAVIPGVVMGVAVSGDYAYIVAGYEAGLRVIDVSDPANPSEVGSYLGLSSAQDVAVAGNYAYVVDGWAGLRVIDVSDPTNPSEAGFFYTSGDAAAVAVVGNYAYVTADYSGLQVLDVGDPTNPIAVGSCDTPGWAQDVAVAGAYAYVADGWDGGLRVIDVSDPTNPSEVGSYYIDGSAVSVAVVGDYAYVMDDYYGLRIIDVSDPAAPIAAGSYDTLGYPRDIAVAGSYAYVASAWAGLRIIDVSDPTGPAETGSHDTPGSAQSVAVAGNYAYVADGMGSGLRIIDVSDPTALTEAGFYITPGDAIDVAVTGNYAYVADGWDGGLRIIDVSDPTTPTEVGYYDTPGTAQGVALSGDYAYVADGTGNGLRIINILDPTAPTEAGFYITPGYAQDVAVAGSYAYVADGWDGGLRIINVSDPTTPTEAGSYDTPGYAQGVAASGGYAYIADGMGSGLRVVDTSDPTAPTEAGFYITPGDAIDVAVAGIYAYLADGWGLGLRIIDVSDPAAPTEAGFCDTPGYAQGVALAGSYAYVADGWEGGLRVIDVSDPTVITEAGFYALLGYAQDVLVAGNYAYVADDYYGLHIIEISDPTVPSEVGLYGTPGYARDVALAGDHAYVAADYNGLRVIDVSDPANPSEVGSFYTGGGAVSVVVAGNIAYVGEYYYGLRILDVSDPAAPIEVGSYTTPGEIQDLAVAGDYAYLAGGWDGGLRVIDVSDPEAPTEAGFYEMPGSAVGVAVAGNYAYVVNGSALRILDISDPAALTRVGLYDMPGGAYSVVVIGGYAFVTADYNGLRILDVLDPAAPSEVGSYNTPGYARSVAVAGNDAYVADGDGGLIILRVTGLKAETSTVITSDAPDPSQPDQPVSVAFEVTGSPGVPSGTVTVTVAGEAESCTDTLTSGVGECEITLSHLGTYTLTATYSGDEHYLPSSTTAQHTVAKSDTVTTILSDEPDPSNVEQAISVSFRVTADDGTPSGTVTVTVGGEAESCTDTLASGVGECEITFGHLGTYTLTAAYGGDEDYLPSSTTAQHTVAKGETTTRILLDEPDPSSAGQAIGVTFEVTADYGTPSGSVTVSVAGEAQSCSGTLADGTGGCNLTLNDPRKYTLTATYSGDEQFLPSSDVEQHTVQKADSATTILVDTPDPSQAGEPITVAFQVTAAPGTPSGTVTVTVAGEAESCAGTLASGVGECEISLGDPGIYTLTASYSGDGHFLPSIDTEQHTVVKADSAAVILSDEPDPSQVGQPITVTFEVTGNHGTPSGMVTVTMVGQEPSCTGTLTGGTGECEITPYTAGTFTLIASYPGDGHFLPSIAVEQHTVTEEQVIKAETTTTILSDQPDPSQMGQPISVTFEVTATSGLPSGAVTVMVAGEGLSCQGTLAAGAGQCEITLDTPGTYILVASYSGDDDFLPSSTTEGHTVVKDESTTSILTDEPDPSQVGQSITVTFEVTASTGTPSGLVTVTVAGEAAICTGTLADGVGACEITLDTPGTHTLTASYSGDADFLPSSATEEHTVLPIKLFLPLVARK